ncbi:unnamed protein product, partial [Phaeothamnion confervicola]
NHVLGPGDEVDIYIYDFPLLEKYYAIRVDGYFYHPIIGDVHAEGLTIPKLEKVLTASLSKVMRRPRFRIGLRSVSPSQITVLGEVMRPGRFEVLPGTPVLEAIAEAGGVTPAADTETAMLVRGETNSNVTISAPTEVGSDYKPPTVQQGDVIYVMAGKKISVTGEVFRPGFYALPRSQGAPMDAIKIAGGSKPN